MPGAGFMFSRVHQMGTSFTSTMAPAADVVGVWGKPTSTLDWCEENYSTTPYIAELWNSISSVVIIGIPIVSLFSLSHYNVERRFYLAYLCFLAVGIGSLAFHVTLLYETQLMDELSMIWGGCALLYLFYDNNSKPNSYNLSLVAFLLLYAVSVTCIYILTKQPVFHQIAFALQIVFIGLRGVHCYRINKQAHSGSLLVVALALYVLGFILWMVDTELCMQIRYIRAYIPAPVDAIFQLHAWWHVLAGLGSHCLLTFCCLSRYKLLKRNAQIWTLGCLPLVAMDTVENGHIL